MTGSVRADGKIPAALARELCYPAGEAKALRELSWAASYAGDADNALRWARQTQRIDPAGIPGWFARGCAIALASALMEADQIASAQGSCTDALSARGAGDLQDQAECLWLMAELDRQTGHIDDTSAHLRESIGLAAQTGDRLRLTDCLNTCGHLCAATGRWAEASTIWAASSLKVQQSACPTCRKTHTAARNPCGRPRKRWDRLRYRQPRNAVRR